MAGRARGGAPAGAVLHVVFTLPADRRHRLSEQGSDLRLLFKASSETMLTIAADPKHLGARIGILSVLHTWGSALTHHPHVHMIVPGGGISPDGNELGVLPAVFLLSVDVLSACSAACSWRSSVAAHQRALQFFGNHVSRPRTRLRRLSGAAAEPNGWSTASARSAARRKSCLSLPLHPSHRHLQSPLIAFDHNGVTFKWKDYRLKGPERYQVMTLATASSSAAFSCTCCPRASTASATMACSPGHPRREHRPRPRVARPSETPQTAPADAADDTHPPTPSHLCPGCGGCMSIIEVFGRGSAPRYQPEQIQMISIRIDTS